MAAHAKQGRYLTLFWTAFTFLCAGLAYLEFGFGKLVLILGLLGTALALVGFLRIKEMEGDTARVRGRGALKLAGLAVAWGGWFVTMAGLYVTPNAAGRIVFALVGIAVSLVGILGVLPVAFGRVRTRRTLAEPTPTLKHSMEHGR